MSTLNSTINGIKYINVTQIDRDLQPWCPLEHTDYESLCQNEYHNVTLRSEEPCEHSMECFNLRAQLDAKDLTK